MTFPKHTKGRKPDREKHVSIIAESFKRYNSRGITADGIKNFIIYNFYRTGYCIELLCKEIISLLISSGEKIIASVEYGLEVLWSFIRQLTDALLDDLGEPLALAASVFVTVKTMRAEAKDTTNTGKTMKVTDYLRDGIKKHSGSVKKLIEYALPVFCGIVFFSVVYLGLHRDLALRVYVNDKDIGIIDSYSVLDNASSIIENQLVATDGQVWELESTVKVVSKGKENTVGDRTLADNILEASDADVSKATGLYVDGEFIGAVKDDGLLEKALNELRAPYENGDENRTVSFVQDVQLVDGIFFADSIVDNRDLAALVKSEVSGEKTYTVQSGDTPSGIASRNDITLSELYALNPGLEGSSSFHAGDVLVVSASVPFLQVKYVDRITRQVEVPFDSKTENNSSLTLGKTQISQKGENGINEQIVDQTYIDGVLQSETVVQTTVIKEPVTQITQKGTNYNGVVIESTGTGSLMWPVPGYTYVSRGFAGQYPSHNGLDICAAIGTPIYAADSGVVTTALYTSRGYGVYVIIEHGGYQTLYGHCSALAVSAGQQVVKGQLIAYVGSTGNSTGPHCHFEVKNGSYRYNPLNWL